METNKMLKAACLMLMASATTSAFAQKMNIEHKGDTTIIKVENPTKYLLLHDIAIDLSSTNAFMP